MALITTQHLEYRPGDFASVVTVNGPIDGTSEAVFRDELETLVKSGALHVIMDCRNVPYINSTGLGTILLFMDRLESAGGSLILARLSDKALMVIEMLGFAPALDIVEDQAQAVSLLTSSRRGGAAPS